MKDQTFLLHKNVTNFFHFATQISHLVMNHSVVIVLLAVRLTTSGATHSHGVTGGVYKARERIHRDILIHDY